METDINEAYEGLAKAILRVDDTIDCAAKEEGTLKSAVDARLEGLRLPRENYKARQVLSDRYGLCGTKHTLEETAIRFQTSVEKIRVIESKALRQLHKSADAFRKDIGYRGNFNPEDLGSAVHQQRDNY